MVSRKNFPNQITLKNDGLPILLQKVAQKSWVDYPREEQTVVTFQANDLAKTQALLLAKGVNFLLPEPFKVGVGIATKFRDPFGNVHSLLEQQIIEIPQFEEPRIYNAGYYLEDISMARKIFCEQLGFVVRTEKYFPAVPLGTSDGNFAFMLHERKGLTALNEEYGKQAQTVIQFQTGNLENVRSKLAAVKVKILPLVSGKEEGFAFVLSSGVAAEMIKKNTEVTQK